jgi:hypothetical protein
MAGNIALLYISAFMRFLLSRREYVIF